MARSMGAKILLQESSSILGNSFLQSIFYKNTAKYGEKMEILGYYQSLAIALPWNFVKDKEQLINTILLYVYIYYY